MHESGHFLGKCPRFLCRHEANAIPHSRTRRRLVRFADIVDDCALAAADFFYQLLLVGEDAGRPFGIDQSAIHFDLKNPAARLDERDLRRQRCRDLCRQTGGMFAITSLVAEFDGDQHAAPPACKICFVQKSIAPAKTTALAAGAHRSIVMTPAWRMARCLSPGCRTKITDRR
ncbi:MAG: hypothetical protein A2091_12505 [Desulfuromonadales bacterium GWD2_61_12]|nr:MAG: hypothetical protein A2005_02985 [Desulfuromonadales bacterium GWC2_61_20]OGR33151.1 MAG: hypothetical protein A2091_12505 [Desulfuromonadales bacterium GWD2_61_12]